MCWVYWSAALLIRVIAISRILVSRLLIDLITRIIGRLWLTIRLYIGLLRVDLVYGLMINLLLRQLLRLLVILLIVLLLLIGLMLVGLWLRVRLLVKLLIWLLIARFINDLLTEWSVLI